MIIQGTIRPSGDGSEFNRPAWCKFIASRPEFRRAAPRTVKDPITGETTTVNPPEDAAEVIIDGNAVGNVYWSSVQRGMIHLRVKPAALPLVKEWAEEMGGSFNWDSSGG
jgi:hypothetical protein